jgi:hypothetical protein
MVGSGLRYLRWARIGLALSLTFIGAIRGVGAVIATQTPGTTVVEQPSIDVGEITNGSDTSAPVSDVPDTSGALGDNYDPTPADITMAFVDLYNEVHYAPAGLRTTDRVTARSLAVLGSISDAQVQRLLKGPRDVGTVLIAKIDPELISALRSRGDFMLGAVRVAATHVSFDGGSISYHTTVSSRGRRAFYFRGGIVYDVDTVHRRLTSRVMQRLAGVW